MKRLFLILFVLLSLHPCNIIARSYPFTINIESSVTICRSTEPGTKMVRVIATGRNVDKAIDRAMLDAVVALAFYGASGTEEVAGCPPILIDGRQAYDANKKTFQKFFKKGAFLPYVKKVNSTYPMGADNVSVSGGRRIQILLVVETQKLSKHFEKLGIKTISSELRTY